MKRKRIILDLNGVVQHHARWQIIKFCISEILALRMSPAAVVRIIGAIRARMPFAEIDRPKIQRYFETFRHINIPFIRGTKAVVKKILAKYPVHVCSANAYAPHLDKKYADFLTERLGRFAEINFIPPRGSKLPFYESMSARFPGDDIHVIDDTKRHIDDAAAAGLIPLWVNKKRGYKNLVAAVQAIEAKDR